MTTKLSTPTEQTPLPPSWRLARLGDVCESVRGINFPSGEGTATIIDGSVACLTTSGVQNEVDWNSRRYIPTRFLGSEVQYLRIGDILVSTANSKALVGKSCVVRLLPERATFGAFVTVLRVASESADLDYVFHYLRSQDATQYFFRQSSNTTNISNLRVSELLELEIPLPPLPEQHRITARLNAVMAEIAHARAAAQAALDAANALPAALLRAVFESDEGKKWKTVRIGDVCHRRQDIVHPRDGTKGALRFVGLENIESNTGRRLGEQVLDAEALDGRKPRFSAGDVLYGYLRPYLNKVWVAEFDGVSSVDQYAFRVDKDRAIPQYVSQYMRSPVYLNLAPVGFTPGFLPRIRSEEVESVPIPLPPLTE